MKLSRVRTIAALTCGGVIAVPLLTGCNSDDKAAPSGAPADTVSAGVGGGNNVKKSSGAPLPASKGGPAVCRADQLKAEIQEQDSDTASTGIATLILTNRSSADCVIPAGWVPIGHGGPRYTALASTRVRYPGGGQNVTLRPKTSVFAGMKWRTSPACTQATHLGVAWWGSWIPAGYAGDKGLLLCDSLTLGTIQPTMNGTNFR
jgi:hypothetical protein